MSEFDENKANAAMDQYSRAIAALGIETMRSLGTFDVLIVGLKGVGVETAKNLILAGKPPVSCSPVGVPCSLAVLRVCPVSCSPCRVFCSLSVALCDHGHCVWQSCLLPCVNVYPCSLCICIHVSMYV